MYASLLNRNNDNLKKNLFFFVSVFLSAEEGKEEGRNSVCKLLEQHSGGDLHSKDVLCFIIL